MPSQKSHNKGEGNGPLLNDGAATVVKTTFDCRSAFATISSEQSVDTPVV